MISAFTGKDQFEWAVIALCAVVSVVMVLLTHRDMRKGIRRIRSWLPRSKHRLASAATVAEPTE